MSSSRIDPSTTTRDDPPIETLPPEVSPVGPMPADALPLRPEDATAPIIDGSPPGGRWVAGTLTYTTAGLIALFFWLLWGDFALSTRDRSVGPVVQLFLKQLNTTDTTMALLMSTLPPIIGLILSPIVSYKSDRYRSRWGRRIPFLLIPTPVVFLSMIGIGYSPQIGAALFRAVGGDLDQIAGTTLIAKAAFPGPLHACILGVFALCWTLFEVAVIVSSSVIGGLINDVVPRPLLGRFYGLFRAVSLGAGMIFNYFIIGHAETHLTAIFIGVGTLFGVGFTLMCLMVREGDYPPPEATGLTNDHRAGGFLAAMSLYFRECFSNSYYRWAFAAITLSQLTFIPFNTFSVPYAKQIHMDMDRYGLLVATSYAVSLVGAYPIGWLVDRFHSLRMGMATMFIYVASMLYGIFFVRGSETFGVALVLHTVLSGAYFTATASMSQALLPRMKFGQFASAAGMVSSVATIAFSPVLGIALDASDHNYRLTFVAGLALCVLCIVCMWVTLSYYLRMGGREGRFVAPGDEGEFESRGFEVGPARH